MAQKFRNDGAVESGAVAASYTDQTGAYMDYDSGGLFAQFGAKASAGGSIGLKLRTILAGVATTVLTFTSAGAATFLGAVTTQALAATTLAVSSTSTFSNTATHTVAGFTHKFIPPGTGEGDAQVQDWYRPDGTTVKARVGFQSNSDNVFYVGSRVAGSSTVLTSGAGTNALTLNSAQLGTFAAGLLVLSGATNGETLTLQPTWNNAALTYTGLYMSVTDTVSNASSYLIDCRVGGSSKFSAFKTGALTIGSTLTLTTGNVQLANGQHLRGTRNSGGLNHNLIGNETGTDRVLLQTTGDWVLINGSNDNMLTVTTTSQMIINQFANDGDIITCRSTDVDHGMTAITDTNAFFGVRKNLGSDGGVLLYALADGTTGVGFYLLSAITATADTTKAINGSGVINFDSAIKSGTTRVALGANGNLAVFSTAGTARFILDADGDSHQDVGTAWTNFDTHDDIALLNLLAAKVTRCDDPLRQSFNHWLQQDRGILEQTRLVTFNADGHHFMNMSRLAMLHTGAIRQIGGRLTRVETRQETLERVLRNVIELNPRIHGRQEALALLN